MHSFMAGHDLCVTVCDTRDFVNKGLLEAEMHTLMK